MIPMRYWFDSQNTTDDQVIERISDAIDLVFSELRKYHTAAAVNAKLGLTTYDAVLAVKADWANDFAVLTPKMVHRGMKKACSQEWCPTLGQFIALCKPTPEESFYEALAGIKDRSNGLMGKWACPAVYWAAQAFGTLDLKQAQWNFHGKRWTKCFNDAMEKQDAGRLDAVPQPVPVNARLGNEPAKCDPNVAREAMEKINGMLKKSVGRGVFTFGAPNA
jgi:hypothetical protein